ncbi:MAG TPA: Xaa-Pro peptidase family protein [Candidatus Methylomirabilis sp.]|nr:Xaa-Pro peptidase family protein [Candidatus Methylomirabilis sp.]
MTEPTLLFRREEYTRRIEAVRGEMRVAGADLVLVDEAEHLFYLTGFDRSATRYQVCAVPLDGEPVMFLRSLDEPNFLERSWLRDYVTVPDWEEPVEVLARVLADRGWASGRIGLELDSNYLTVKRWQEITRALPDATFVDFGGVLRRLRLRKSPAEIAYLRHAAHIADHAIVVAADAAGEGRSERDAAAAASRTFIELGADNGRAGVITAGARSGTLHGGLGHHLLRGGDILHMELVPQVHGYSARLMRPTVIGRPSPHHAETARRMIEIQDRQLDAMKPDAVARDVDRICREAMLAAGLRDRYENATGYTLGYYAPWSPRTSDFTRMFVPTADWVLEPGMVFHMYVSARGLAFSETVAVTESGAERLTRAERGLIVR